MGNQESTAWKKNFHGEYKKWVATFYPNVSKDRCADILSAACAHDDDTHDPPSGPLSERSSEPVSPPEDTRLAEANPAACILGT